MKTKTKNYCKKWCSCCKKFTTGEYKSIVKLFICGECEKDNYISYGCECGYPTTEYNQYQIINEKLVELDIEEIVDENNVIYPICSSSTYYECSQGWNEIHYCPECKKEFSFSNGT